jgi:uncharacterized RmlC-like cupin family protein
MHLLEIPPGVSAEPHYHEAHETILVRATVESRFVALEPGSTVRVRQRA